MKVAAATLHPGGKTLASERDELSYNSVDGTGAREEFLGLGNMLGTRGGQSGDSLAALVYFAQPMGDDFRWARPQPLSPEAIRQYRQTGGRWMTGILVNSSLREST